ncbi:glutathione S-transferase N-terminal domain-containing protein [Ramlibacter sp. AW1]|uniref:Glutathione S-transferase N-terminal domain-containing protein n=1 Tax=Ramlibacter aurantiacus TaxID=2801330 RepID=A0A937D130_9BURK|nr:glutathione S-transferase N-terminal domain-containing protein [Ramlibacter aurantiacus]MBL0420094.1 glutathione S-transferase N-terminal domain-containing protein [Ramlibacter aurantiacus]
MRTPTSPVAIVADPLSSACLRVLCALDHKGVDLPLRPLKLREREQHGPQHRDLNPALGVPVLLLENGEAIMQSMAILEYLEACYPQMPLVPADPLQAARVRSLCHLVACDIHPLTNMRVRDRVATAWGEAAGRDWVQHWFGEGQAALEGWLAHWSGPHCIGDSLGLADFLVVPAVFTMVRLNCAPASGTRLAEVFNAGLRTPAFRRIVAAGGRDI